MSNSAQTILLVEDDDATREAVCRYLQRRDIELRSARSLAEAQEVLAEDSVDLVLTDIHLPDGSGLDLADHATRASHRFGVVVISGDHRVETAIDALRRGAADFVHKPFAFHALDEAIDRAELRRGLSVGTSASANADATPAREWRERFAPGMLGQHEKLLKVFSVIRQVCDTDCSVLVTGESGTGKELVARALHEASDRANKPFVTVNCAAIPENLLESELFGHAKGAFTGATAPRIGKFAMADGGTIFLDEIGELPLGLQAKLLRVVQEKELCPVGESRTRRVDVRVVAATHRDLDAMCDEGKFREDLLYRIQVVPVELPPLRDRGSDIPELAAYFIQRVNERRGRSVSGVTGAALDALCSYEWPGNIRQLENTIERMVLLKGEGELDLDDLPRKVRPESEHSIAPGDGRPVLPDAGIDLRDAVEQFENALIVQALERTGWNKNQAANVLRMNRTTLVEKLKKKKLRPQIGVA
ncbi:MAG: sigma-54 dependent transcriptional regulator [Myxococcales bacterium]|nr:sigma-54 dependent transcriptional regulator [Myxococcales bacterium]